MINIRVHTTDTMTGEEELHDLTVSALNAQAIADAMKEETDEVLQGVFLTMKGDSGAFILEGDGYLLAGTLYTVFV